jgi:RNA polymerase sigma-70 factor, ECF subfamily
MSEPHSLVANGLPLDSVTDADLVRAARQDRAAFAPLYRRYVTSIYRYIYSRVGHRADAEDLTSQVFSEAIAALDRYREEGHFAAWLFTIAARRIADHHRQNRPELPLELVAERLTAVHNPPAEVVQQETLRHLAQLVGQLPEDKQELLRLRFAAGLTYAQIGTVTERSEAAVKMAMNRLLKQLQQQWEDEHE